MKRRLTFLSLFDGTPWRMDWRRESGEWTDAHLDWVGPRRRPDGEREKWTEESRPEKVNRAGLVTREGRGRGGALLPINPPAPAPCPSRSALPLWFRWVTRRGVSLHCAHFLPGPVFSLPPAPSSTALGGSTPRPAPLLQVPGLPSSFASPVVSPH